MIKERYEEQAPVARPTFSRWKLADRRAKKQLELKDTIADVFHLKLNIFLDQVMERVMEIVSPEMAKLTALGYKVEQIEMTVTGHSDKFEKDLEVNKDKIAEAVKDLHELLDDRLAMLEHRVEDLEV